MWEKCIKDVPSWLLQATEDILGKECVNQRISSFHLEQDQLKKDLEKRVLDLIGLSKYTFNNSEIQDIISQLDVTDDAKLIVEGLEHQKWIDEEFQKELQKAVSCSQYHFDETDINEILEYDDSISFFSQVIRYKELGKQCLEELMLLIKDSELNFSNVEISEMITELKSQLTLKDHFLPYLLDGQIISPEVIISEQEFFHLVNEVRNQKFTHSKQVSKYIVDNKLGRKYKHISGFLTMTREGNSWELEGGFPSNIYARLCCSLSLSNQGTSARAGSFESFKKRSLY